MNELAVPDDLRLLDEVSQQFLRAVNLTMGKDISNAAVQVLEGVLGKDWKDRLVINKLSNRYQTTGAISMVLEDRFRYTSGSTDVQNKIRVIKELRFMSGMGLIEAKKTTEQAEVEAVVFKLSEFGRDANPIEWERKMLNSIELIRSCGFRVNYA